ncbi:MAG: DNA-binding protein WhiA [Evtepia gabavorous]
MKRGPGYPREADFSPFPPWRSWPCCGSWCAFDPSGPAHHINFGMLEETHCRLSFLRGAFLAGGSVTDPQKGYHLELATTHLRVSRELDTLLLELGYAPKETTRKANYITYFKQSEAIEDLLTAIGAPVSAMELMNAKAEKLLRNGVNRRVNCEAANVDKTVDAALGAAPGHPDSAGPGGPGDPLSQAPGGRPASRSPP